MISVPLLQNLQGSSIAMLEYFMNHIGKSEDSLKSMKGSSPSTYEALPMRRCAIQLRFELGHSWAWNF